MSQAASSDWAVHTPLVTLDDIRRAAARIEGVVLRTPLLPALELEDELGVEVRMKCENLQRTGSFKMRGAYNFISRRCRTKRSRRA